MSTRLINGIVYEQRHSLGREGVLGDLYDAYYDQLTGENIFQNPLSISLVDTEDVSDYANIEYVFTETLAEKFEKLQVDTSSQLSVLCKYTLHLSGSAQYLIDSYISCPSKKCIRRSIVYNVPTKVQQFNLLDPDLITYINVDAIQRTLATHVVVKIKWGANAVLTLQAEADSMENFCKAKEDLEARLVSMGSEISGLSEFGCKNTGQNNRIDFSVVADVRPNGPLLRTVEEALKFMGSIPNILKEFYEGLGKPLVFFLIPVNEIMKICKLNDSRHSLIVHQISDSEVFHWVRFFDLFNHHLKGLFDLEETIKSKNQDSYLCNYPCLLKLVSGSRKDLILGKCDIQKMVAEAVVEVRKKGNLDDLEEIKIKVWRNINFLEEQLYDLQRYLHSLP